MIGASTLHAHPNQMLNLLSSGQLTEPSSMACACDKACVICRHASSAALQSVRLSAWIILTSFLCHLKERLCPMPPQEPREAANLPVRPVRRSKQRLRHHRLRRRMLAASRGHETGDLGPMSQSMLRIKHQSCRHQPIIYFPFVVSRLLLREQCTLAVSKSGRDAVAE